MPSFFESNQPDQAQLDKLVESLRLDADAEVNALEIKTMLSQLLQVKIDDVLDADAAALTQLSREELGP